MGFGDLTPENTIKGGTDGTDIGNDGVKLKVRVYGGDPLTSAAVTIDSAHHEIHEGSMFHFSTLQTLSDGGVFEVYITAGSTNYEHFLWSFNSRERTKIEFFEAPTLSGGTTETLYNKKRGDVSTYPGTVKSSPTVTADGTKLESVFTDGEHLVRGQHEWILDPGETYLLRITSDRNNNDMSIEFNVYLSGAV